MDTTNDRPTGRHQVNIGHLVMGLAFAGIVAVWAVVQADFVTGDEIRWLMPIPWVVAGVVGLTVTAVTGSRRYAVRQVGWVGDRPEPAAEPTPEDPSAAVEETAPLTARPDRPSEQEPDHEEKS